MISTGYEPFLREPGGDKIFSNGGIQSSGKSLQSKNRNLPTGSSGSLKSEDYAIFGSCKKPRSTSRSRQKALLPNVDSPPSIFHPADPGAKQGIRKISPVDPCNKEFSDMARNVRRRPSHSNPHNLVHLEPHAEWLSVDPNQQFHMDSMDMSGSNSLPNMSIEDAGGYGPMFPLARELKVAVKSTISCTPDSAEKERHRMREDFASREQEIRADWGHVAKTMVVKAHGMMQEHIIHVQRGLTQSMENCLDVRTAEISQQAALETAGHVSAVQKEAVAYVQQQGANVVQTAAAHIAHVEQVATEIIEDETTAVVQEAHIHCANIQSVASAAVSKAQEAAHAAASSKELAVQESIAKRCRPQISSMK